MNGMEQIREAEVSAHYNTPEDWPEPPPCTGCSGRGFFTMRLGGADLKVECEACKGSGEGEAVDIYATAPSRAAKHEGEF